MTLAAELLGRIDSRDARVGVIGLGYVGLPVAVSFAEEGFRVLGMDLDAHKVVAIEEGRSYLEGMADERIESVRKAGKLRATHRSEDLGETDVILVSVPTPLTEGTPDLSRVVEGARSVAGVLRRGMLVVLESTTYPGTTEELVAPILESSGLSAGTDFFLAYSPERIDPANPLYSFSDIPKVVGGVDQASTEAAARLYGQVVPKVVTVSGTREAELTKLIENTFRHVNIALVNELAVYAHEMGVDIWEAIEAAATKPFGFLPFWPGPGWGGHCIPLDPAYLSWRIRRDQAHDVRFVELAHTINAEMPRHVVERISLLLNDSGKPVRGSRILGIGVAYKGGTEDTRESPGLKVLTNLAQRGADVSYHDPLVSRAALGDREVASVDLEPEVIASQDLVVILVPQVGVDWDVVVREASLIFDCCNATRQKSKHIVKL